VAGWEADAKMGNTVLCEAGLDSSRKGAKAQREGIDRRNRFFILAGSSQTQQQLENACGAKRPSFAPSRLCVNHSLL
jgi:hypothetical protein